MGSQRGRLSSNLEPLCAQLTAEASWALANVPEVFVCQKCRDSKFDIRRSNRSRMGSRKLFLD